MKTENKSCAHDEDMDDSANLEQGGAAETLLTETVRLCQDSDGGVQNKPTAFCSEVSLDIEGSSWSQGCVNHVFPPARS